MSIPSVLFLYRTLAKADVDTHFPPGGKSQTLTNPDFETKLSGFVTYLLAV